MNIVRKVVNNAQNLQDSVRTLNAGQRSDEFGETLSAKELEALRASYPKLRKGSILSIDNNGKNLNLHSFLLNPTNITYKGGVNWSEINAPGMYGSTQQYVNTKPIEISFTLQLARRMSTGPFQTVEEQRKFTDKDLNAQIFPILNCFCPSSVDDALFVPAPRLRLDIGAGWVWDVVGKDWTLKATQWNRNLDMLVAEIDVSFVTVHDTSFSATLELTRFLVNGL